MFFFQEDHKQKLSVIGKDIVQAINDANCCIPDVVAKWPESAHDGNIFDNSRIRMLFETHQTGNGLLLSDSAYPTQQYLITPLNNERNDAENLFIDAHIRSRNVIERTFSIW